MNKKAVLIFFAVLFTCVPLFATGWVTLDLNSYYIELEHTGNINIRTDALSYTLDTLVVTNIQTRKNMLALLLSAKSNGQSIKVWVNTGSPPTSNATWTDIRTNVP